MDLLDSSTFAEHLAELLDDWHVPGITIALVQNDKVASRGFGYTQPDKKVAMKPDMLFSIASCSKAFTACLVGMCVADEELPHVRWNSVVSSLLPGEFVLSDERYTESVNLDDIVSHRTGVAGANAVMCGLRSTSPDSSRTITNKLRHTRINAPIRTVGQYNNLMYCAAAYLSENLMGMSWSDALQTKIFSPLGMESSFVHTGAVPDHLHSLVVAGHNWINADKCYKMVEATAFQPEAEGSSCIVSSVQDHIKWVHAMINQHSPITPEIYKELVRPRVIESADNRSQPFTSPELCAAGWYVRYYRGYEMVHHGGNASGFGSWQFFLPALKFGGVLHGNSHSAPYLLFAIAFELIDQVLGILRAERPSWAAIFKQMADADSSPGKTNAPTTQGELQVRPLSDYIGNYWHPAYQYMKVEVRKNKLFIDASDRGFPFEVILEHIAGQTTYYGIVHMLKLGDTKTIDADFAIEGEKVVKLGLELDGAMVWFDRRTM